MLPSSRFASTARTIGLALACATATLASAQPLQMFKPGPGPDELWDVTMKMEMVGMPMAMPARTVQVCKNHAAANDKLMPQRDNCTTSNVKTVGNKTTFNFACTGDEPMAGTAEFSSTPTSYDGKMQMKAGKRGEEMEMTQTMAGKKVGTCTDTSKQAIAQVNTMTEQGRQQACKVGLDSLQPEEFVSDKGICKSQRKQFCDKVAGIATASRTAAGFRTSMPSPPQLYETGFKACGQSIEATRKAACADGASTRDWSFIGSGNCDDDVRTLGDANCKGRSYTGMDRALVPLCNRYASIMRGSGAAGVTAGGTPGAQPPTPTPATDPVQEGVNSLRKLLPF